MGVTMFFLSLSEALDKCPASLALLLKEWAMAVIMEGLKISGSSPLDRKLPEFSLW